MAPSSYKNKSSQRSRVEKRSHAFSDGGTPAKRGRVEHDVIEGIDIFSFENELELEYFTNIEEPLPRRIHACRGFDEADYEAASRNRIKSNFDLFIKKRKKDHDVRVEVPQCDDLIVLSDDECTVEPTAVSHTYTARPVDINDEPVQLSQTADFVTIEIYDDSDDDVVMVGDPNAPLPKPVRDCVCPNCGKVKRTDQNRRVAESDKDSGVDDVSIIMEITDEDVPVVSAPIPNKNTPLQLKDLTPKQIPAQSAGIRKEVPVQPAEVLTEEVPSPAAIEVLTEEVPSPGAIEILTEELPSLAAEEPLSASISRSPRKVNNPFCIVDQQLPSSLSLSHPHHISTKPSNDMSPSVQEPSRQLKRPAAVPKTVRVVSKESGKTFFLKINGAKSKILKPSTTPSDSYNSSKHPQSFHYLRPGEKPCGVSSSEAEFPARNSASLQVQEPPPKSVVGPHMVEVAKVQLTNEVSHIQQPPPMSVVRPRAVEMVKIQQPSLNPKSVVGPEKPEVCKIEPPNGGMPHTYHIKIPPNTMQVTLPPGFSEKNKSIKKAQPTNRAKGQVQVKNSIVAKPGVVVAQGSSPQTGLVIVSPQSQVKQQAKTVANGQNTDTDVASDFSVLKSACLNEIKRDSAVLESPMPSNAKVESPITESSPEPVVLEDDTKSVVKDLIDFVCRRENFPSSYPYDQERTEQLSIDVPCRQLRCQRGCVCVSLAKKNVRRVRCKNASCIFGCVCLSHGVVVPANRHAKAMPNMKVLGLSRRKQVLTVLPDFDDDCNRIGAQPALKNFLPVQKVSGVSRSVSVSHGTNPVIGLQGPGSATLSASKGSLSRNVPGVLRSGSVHSSSVSQASSPRSLVPGHSLRQGSGFGVSTQPASKGLQFPLKVLVPKTSVTRSQRLHPNADLASAKESLVPLDVPNPNAASKHPAHRLSVPVVQPRSFFGREKTPIPERALMCLTPGFGYVPLSEIHPTVTLDSPFKPGSTKSFLSVRQATQWLNSKLEIHLNTKMPPDLRWVVADGQTIEKKQQHRLSVDLLSSPNCTISRNGAVFSS